MNFDFYTKTSANCYASQGSVKVSSWEHMKRLTSSTAHKIGCSGHITVPSTTVHDVLLYVPTAVVFEWQYIAGWCKVLANDLFHRHIGADYCTYYRNYWKHRYFGGNFLKN